jgi:hypothetical protein
MLKYVFNNAFEFVQESRRWDGCCWYDANFEGRNPSLNAAVNYLIRRRISFAQSGSRQIKGWKTSLAALRERAFRNRDNKPEKEMAV